MRQILKPWLLLVALMIVAALAAVACGDDDDDDDGGTPTGTAAATGGTDEVLTDVGVTDTEIKLGQHIVQSGNLAAVYAPVAPTLQAYFKKVNDEDGGVCGRDITLIVEDDQYSPATARDRAQKLVEQDKIAAFIGNLGTPPNTGSASYINEQEVPDLFLATGVPGFADAATLPWTVLYNPDYISEGHILADYVNENLPDQTVGILYQNDDFGKSGRDGFKENFTGTVAEEQSYDSTATDINSQLATLRAADPDILYLYSTPAFTTRVFGYMSQNSWTPQVVQSYVNSATTLATLVGGDAGAAAGFEQIAGTISANYILDPIADADNPAIVEHTRIMGAFGGPPVGSLSVYAQAIAETTVKTLQTACDNGDLTRAGIMAAAESLDGFAPSVILPGISITLSKTDHLALQQLMPVEIQADGTLKALADEPISSE
ncbi:MAG: ABC transporter substrate-binding protein [Chloroflexota bacterium]